MIDADGYIRAVAPVLGLTISPEHAPGVAANLRLAARMATLIQAVPIASADEAAPVFVAARAVPMSAAPQAGTASVASQSAAGVP